jgi:hypothetical protein
VFKFLKYIYLYFLTMPDRLYPFASKVGGRRVRGRRSYERAVARALTKYGFGRLGYKLFLYREFFHFVGSVLFIVLATEVSKAFFGGDTALYMLLWAAIFALAFQEFYVHPRRYGQLLHKGIADWLVWVVPMILYIFR